MTSREYKCDMCRGQEEGYKLFNANSHQVVEENYSGPIECRHHNGVEDLKDQNNKRHLFKLVQIIPDFDSQCKVLEFHCKYCGIEVFNCIKNEEAIDETEDGSIGLPDTRAHWNRMDETCVESYLLAAETPCIKERKDMAAIYSNIISSIDECLLGNERIISNPLSPKTRCIKRGEN